MSELFTAAMVNGVIIGKCCTCGAEIEAVDLEEDIEHIDERRRVTRGRVRTLVPCGHSQRWGTLA